ncbi:lysozyme inhibitor LprI family protein [Stenotrophomonas sp. G106K1]|uniref:lysozyme inhibitor LprI family protein n=1 Tax=Stenotrophomonas sp. G106K1 TaxID=3134792 RepID=UPI0030F43612
MASRTLGIVVAAMAVLCTGQVHAASALSAAYQACSGHAQGTIEEAACLSSESDRQDRRLNQAYQQLRERLDVTAKAHLQAAQRAWLQSRQRDGELETALYDDSQPGNLQQKLNDTERLRARADQLETYLRLIGP